MEKIFEIARKFRLILFMVAIVAVVIANNADAFWPADWVPTGPHLPEPKPLPEIV